MSIIQPGLRPGRYLTLQERYLEWRYTPEGRAVFEACLRAALKLAARGFRHYGVAALYEAARYDHALRIGPDIDGWRLNNSYRSRLARDLMAAEPLLRDFFETRILTA